MGVIIILSLEDGISPDTQTIDIKSLIVEITKEYGSKFADKGLFLDIQKSVGNLTFLHDPRLVKEALLNLFDNIFFYSDKGIVRVKLLKTKNGIELIISNPILEESITSKKDFLENTVNQFKRGTQSNKVNPGGTGLGVSIAKRIIERRGGEFNLRVNNNRFIVSLTFMKK